MQVLGKEQAFMYTGPGDTAMFVADCVHSSCPPEVGTNCVKLVASWVECGRSSPAAASQLMSACTFLSTGGVYELTGELFEVLQTVECTTMKMANATKYLYLVASMAVAQLCTTGTQVNEACREGTLLCAGSR